jgi:hypothetical protein
MKKNNTTVLKGLHIASWIIFIGLCIEAGALLFNFVFTLFQPLATRNVYSGLDLSVLYEKEFPHFVGIMSCIVVLAFMKSYLFYLVVKLFTQLNIVTPFSVEIAKIIEKISYEAFSIAILSIITKQYAKRLIQNGYELSDTSTYWNDTAAFLMMAAIVYVISQIFKRGIELQQENDLTI